MGVTAGHDDETTDHLDTLKAAAARISAISGWFASDEGVEEMLDKSYVPGSVHRSVIVDILHDGIETGQADPIRTVARALTVLAGETGGDRRLLEAARLLEPLIMPAEPASDLTSDQPDIEHKDKRT